MNNRFFRMVFFIFSLINANNASAWVYPEHRRIAILAIQNLPADQRALLNRLWADARVGHESRLTEEVIFPSQGLKPTQMDFAAWTAIAGDHSCSPQNLLSTVLQTKWILNVADIAAQLESDLVAAKNRSQQTNALCNSDIRFQSADAEYATRAGSNNAHFLVFR